MVEDKYIVRYWPEGLGNRSKVHEFSSKEAALVDAKRQALDEFYYAVYEAKVIKTNIN